jgi:hypothetical protein
MASVIQDIAAFDAMRSELESQHLGEWVVFHDQELVGFYLSMEKAAEDAVRRFGRGPYLIRQIGAPPVTLPASAMYSAHAGR